MDECAFHKTCGREKPKRNETRTKRKQIMIFFDLLLQDTKNQKTENQNHPKFVNLFIYLFIIVVVHKYCVNKSK